MTLKVPRGIDPGWDRNPGNYDDHAPALRRLFGLHPHEKVRHNREHESAAHRQGGRKARSELKRGRAAHLFDEGIDTRVLIDLVLSRGKYEGQDAKGQGWHRVWAEVGSIGWRVLNDGSRTHRLVVAELKARLRADGTWYYHLIPRPRQRTRAPSREGGSDGQNSMG